MIQGDRIRQLRELHCLTQSDLAQQVPRLTQSQLSRLESDLAPEPDEEVTALLCAALGVTRNFLDRAPAKVMIAHSPHFRARTRLTRSVKDAALQWARLIYEQYASLREAGSRIPVTLLQLPELSPKDAAHECRRILGFDQRQPLPFLLLAMERVGVVVLGVPIKADALDAFSAWSGEDAVMAVLDGSSGDRRRFTAAHELAHLILHSSQSRGRDIENEADEFAAELLMPLDAIRHAMPRHPTLSSLTMLKTEWGVSIRALILRARELGTIDQDRATSLYKQISARGWNKSEPGFVPAEKPRAFMKLTEIVYGAGPNVERLAFDAGWSHEMAFKILDQCATSEQLPHLRAPRSPSNVIEFPGSYHPDSIQEDRA